MVKLKPSTKSYLKGGGNFAEIGEGPKMTNCCRAGTRRVSVIRPVKITLNSSDHVNQILRNAKLSRAKDGYSEIYF